MTYELTEPAIAGLVSLAAIAMPLFLWLGKSEFAENRAGWVRLPSNVARKHPLYGLGGWSSALLLILLLGAPACAVHLLTEFRTAVLLSIEQAEIAQYLAWHSQTEEAQFDSLRIMLWPLHLYVLVCLALALAAASLLGFKSRFFRPFFVSLSLAFLVSYALLSYKLSADVFAAPAYVSGRDLLTRILLISAVTLPWAVYAWRSRRLAVTQAGEVRPKDAFLTASAIGKNDAGTPHRQRSNDAIEKSARFRKEESAHTSATPSQHVQHSNNAVSEEATLQMLENRFPNAAVAFRYRGNAWLAYLELSARSMLLAEEFSRKLDQQPDARIEPLLEQLRDEYYANEISPFEDEALNDAYARIFDLGYDARAEFRRAVRVLGRTVEPARIANEILRKTKVERSSSCSSDP